jgi:hypothetical protein
MGESSLKAYCRYEILVPLYYNDGALVEKEKLLETSDELMRRFPGMTTYPIDGRWKDGDKIYYDKLIVFKVDIEESNNCLPFIREYKEKLKASYKQQEIYITRQKIEVI